MHTKNQNLSARWTHAEHEGVVVDKMGYADISSWSRGTTQPVRPEVPQQKHVSRKITSLAACEHKTVAVDVPHNPKERIAPHVTKFDEGEHFVKSAKRTAEITAMFESIYKAASGKKMVKRKGKPIDFSKRELLADVQGVGEDVLAQLRGNQVPREC